MLELIQGVTLADRIARGPIPLNDAVAIALQIVDAGRAFIVNRIESTSQM